MVTIISKTIYGRSDGVQIGSWLAVMSYSFSIDFFFEESGGQRWDKSESGSDKADPKESSRKRPGGD